MEGKYHSNNDRYTEGNVINVIPKKFLKDKIRINIDEYKSGRYSSRSQAIAVSYSQVLKKHPKCKKSLRRKRS